MAAESGRNGSTTGNWIVFHGGPCDNYFHYQKLAQIGGWPGVTF
jgi:hypothetical protein